MRVLNAGQNHFIVGGSDVYQLALGELLGAQGHEVIPFAAQSPRNLPSAWSPHFPVAADFSSSGPLDALRYVYNPDAARRLDRLLAAHPVDIAHLHIYYGKLTGSILPVLRRRGVPIVQSLHDYKLVCPVYTLQRDGKTCHDCRGGAFHQALRHRCNRGSFARSALTMAESYASLWLGAQDRIDRFIAVSEHVRDSVIAMGVAAEKVSVIPHFVADEAFAVREPVGDYVLYAGRLERGKGVHDVLDIAKRLPGIAFRLAGDGSERPALEARVRDERIANVRFEGRLEAAAVRRLQAGALACVVPSHWQETFGLTTVESMAVATPVVASRVGALPEAIDHDVDGFLCAAGDVEAFVAALTRLLGDSALRRRIGAAAQQKVRERYSAAAHLQRVLALYREVIAAHAGGARA